MHEVNFFRLFRHRALFRDFGVRIGRALMPLEHSIEACGYPAVLLRTFLEEETILIPGVLLPSWAIFN